MHRAYRGCDSTRCWNYSSSGGRYSDIGFRPALEPQEADNLPLAFECDAKTEILKTIHDVRSSLQFFAELVQKGDLGAHYQRFECQNQCDELFDRMTNPELYDFLKERYMDDAAIPQKTWDKFFELLGWYSQEQRCHLWDRALAGETSFSRAGLTYGFFDWQFDLEKFAYQVVKKLLEEREKGGMERNA